MDKYRDEKTLAVLNSLIRSCIQSEESYRKAAEKTDDENLKQVFIIQAYHKSEYVAKLKSEIKRLGGIVHKIEYDENENDFLGYRQLNSEIINCCEEREALAEKNYELAMNEDILWEVIPIVSSQYFETQESLKQIQYLKTNYSESFIHY